jgi:hypothetical protein
MAPKGILKSSTDEKSESLKKVSFEEEDDVLEFDPQKEDAPSSGETVEYEGDTPPDSQIEASEEKPSTSIAVKREQDDESQNLESVASSASVPPSKLQKTSYKAHQTR